MAGYIPDLLVPLCKEGGVVVRGFPSALHLANTQHQQNIHQLDNSRSRMNNLIGQLQVHHFTDEPLWRTYKNLGFTWSNSIGQLKALFFLITNFWFIANTQKPELMDQFDWSEAHINLRFSLEHFIKKILGMNMIICCDTNNHFELKTLFRI